MPDTAPPRAPSGLQARGRAFWRDVTTTYTLSRPELELLREVCRGLDEAERLAGAVAADGVTVEGSKGQTRAHPALAELRATRQTVGRLLAQLALPDPESGKPAVISPLQARSRRGNETRWGGARRGDASTA